MRLAVGSRRRLNLFSVRVPHFDVVLGVLDHVVGAEVGRRQLVGALHLLGPHEDAVTRLVLVGHRRVGREALLDELPLEVGRSS